VVTAFWKAKPDETEAGGRDLATRFMPQAQQEPGGFHSLTGVAILCILLHSPRRGFNVHHLGYKHSAFALRSQDRHFWVLLPSGGSPGNPGAAWTAGEQQIDITHEQNPASDRRTSSRPSAEVVLVQP
jgi:hypothetical protein